MLDEKLKAWGKSVWVSARRLTGAALHKGREVATGLRSRRETPAPNNRPFIGRSPWRLVWVSLFLVIILSLSLWGYLLSPVRWVGAAESQQVFIVGGATARSISLQLKEAGLIRSSRAFQLLSRLSGNSQGMRAGLYEMSPRESSWQLLERINVGDSLDTAVSVTIPEGYNTVQIAHLLEARGIVAADEFLAYLPHAPLPYDFLEARVAHLEPEKRLEGYLFPDTYRFMPGSSPATIVRIMQARFRQVIEPFMPAEVLSGGKLTAIGNVQLDLHQLVSLASIVEREAVVSQERPRIAGVFYNRLRDNWRLESCATVQYVLGWSKPRLSYADLRIESPYNTYRNAGLPPGPIASPGASSLQAVVEPEQTVYFFFVARGDGSHIFSRTNAEHEAAKRLVASGR